MSSKLIKNIGQLITNSDENLGIINDAALVIENGKVTVIAPCLRKNIEYWKTIAKNVDINKQ